MSAVAEASLSPASSPAASQPASPPASPLTSHACPSAPAEPGAHLLGIAGPDGRVHPLRTPMRVDRAFLDAAALHGAPEARMRFAGRCVEGACAQWTGERCGVIERVLARLAEAGDPQAAADLPPCTIRKACRWYAQHGAEACRACSLVITDTRSAAGAPVAAE